MYDDGARLVEADVFLDIRGAEKAEGEVDREAEGSNVSLGFLGIVRSIWTVVDNFALPAVERLLPFLRPIVAFELRLER